MEMTGKPYRNLLSDLVADHELADFKLGEAAKKAPKEEGGLNIESLCAVGETLYIGFRNPIPNGKALIIPLVKRNSAGRSLRAWRWFRDALRSLIPRCLASLCIGRWRQS